MGKHKKHTYACISCRYECKKWNQCLKHMRFCCPHILRTVKITPDHCRWYGEAYHNQFRDRLESQAWAYGEWMYGDQWAGRSFLWPPEAMPTAYSSQAPDSRLSCYDPDTSGPLLADTPTIMEFGGIRVGDRVLSTFGSVQATCCGFNGIPRTPNVLAKLDNGADLTILFQNCRIIRTWEEYVFCGHPDDKEVVLAPLPSDPADIVAEIERRATVVTARRELRMQQEKEMEASVDSPEEGTDITGMSEGAIGVDSTDSSPYPPLPVNADAYQCLSCGTKFDEFEKCDEHMYSQCCPDMRNGIHDRTCGVSGHDQVKMRCGISANE